MEIHRACRILKEFSRSAHFLAMKKLTIREIHEKTGIAVPTLSRWCRKGKFPNAKKITSPSGEYWEIPEADWKAIESGLEEVKRGRPKKN